MTKLLKTGLVLGLLTGVANAEVVFDLGAQQFYYPITKLADKNGYNTVNQFREASYNVDKAIVSTGLTSVKGYYTPEFHSSGYFGVRIKKPKEKASVTFSMYCYLNDDGCSAELLGENGKSVTIDFSYYNLGDNEGRVSVDGTSKYGIGNYETNINAAIEIDSSAINITINGRYTFEVNKSNFKLAKINLSLHAEDSFDKERDKLIALTVSTSD